MSAIKVVMFDIDNTLLDFNECATQSFKFACEKTGLPYENRFMPAFFTINDFLWHQVEDGVLTVDRLHQIRFPTILSALDVKADGTELERLFRLNMKKAAAIVDGALDILNYLKGKYFLAVASNSALSQQTARLKSAGLYGFFDEIFVSEKIGASKPDKAFFDGCMKNLPTDDKQSILFVGDSLSADITGGINYGIKTCWFKRNENLSTLMSPDFTITNLSELKQIL